MDGLEATGRTIEEATEHALNQLGVELEDVDVEVVDRGRGGILGIGAGEARVRVSLKSADVFDLAKETLEELLRLMQVSAMVGIPETSRDQESNRGNPSFDIDGEDAALLIGRHGESLSALQFILNFIISRKAQKRVTATIDVEGYRERRYESLRTLANRIADRAGNSGRTFSMDPMPPRERRVIHMALSNNPKVNTESVGEGAERKVTIIPKRNARNSRGRRSPQTGSIGHLE